MNSRRLLAALAAALFPAVAGAVCAPSAMGIFPASGIAGTSVPATITGTALDGATVTVFGAAGLAISVQSDSSTALSLHLDLDAAAAPGERLLFVTTPGGAIGVSFTINAAGGPVVDAVSPPLLATQGIELDAVVTGANLGGVTPAGIAISGAGVSVLSATPSPDGTSLALAFGVDPAADLGTHAVTLTTPTGSAVLELYVRRPSPTVTAVEPSAAEVGATVPLTIRGTHLTGAALVITTPTTTQDVTIADVATPDDSTLIATLTILPGATASTTEARLLIVTTESGQTTPEFFIVPAGLGPTITGIEPGAGSPGGTVPVTLHGLHLTNGTVTAAAPLSIVGTPSGDDETITAQVSIDSGATVDTDQMLTVTTGAGTANVTFRVIATGKPFIGEVRPPFGNRGSTLTIFVIGVNLGTVVPGTGVQVIDPSNKIHASNAAAVDDRTARATVTIDPTANISSAHHQVMVTTSAGFYQTSNSPFRVNNPGHVPSITDVSPHLVPPGSTTPMTVTGADFAGAGVVVTGPGAVVSNPVVDGTGTLITFDLALAADAPAETRSVVVITQNGTAVCAIASDPGAFPFAAAKLVKTGAVFVVPASGFRLFVFEFSESPLFPAGLRTWDIAGLDGTLTLTRLDANDVQRAFRERHSGWVRVRAVTATNRIATSAAQPIRQ